MKKYYKKKDKRFGFDNKVDIKIAKVPFYLIWIAKRVLVCFLIRTIFIMPFLFYPVVLTKRLIETIDVLIILYLLFLFVKVLFTSCRYASKEEADIQKYFENKSKKDPSIKEHTKVVKDGDWYMIFNNR